MGSRLIKSSQSELDKQFSSANLVSSELHKETLSGKKMREKSPLYIKRMSSHCI